MAENKEFFVNDAPKWMQVLPLIGVVYFVYKYYYKKEDAWSAGSVAVLLFLAGSLPWVQYGNVTPKLTAKNAAGSKKDEPVTEVDDPVAPGKETNAMDKATRQAAIKYIVWVEEKRDTTRRYIPPAKVPERAARIAAFNTLSNDELKVILSLYRFMEDKDAMQAKYGKVPNHELAKKAAMEAYGIDLSAVADIKTTANTAVAKVTSMLNGK